jgi:hypothetical protein
MSNFGKSEFLTIANLMLAIVLIATTSRIEANCLQIDMAIVSEMQPMANCSEMATNAADQQRGSPTQAPSHNKPKMCHVGCLTLLAASWVAGPSSVLAPIAYAAAPLSSPLGINNAPQTPPPRWV